MKRQEVLQALNEALLLKLKALKAEMSDLKDDLTADTKNTSGDKHETSRAMNQLEQERLGKQMEQIESMLNTLKSQRDVGSKTHVAAGQLLRISGAYYFISVPYGRLTVGNDYVFVLSPASPVGEQLIGRAVGESIQFNGNTLLIESILE